MKTKLKSHKKARISKNAARGPQAVFEFIILHPATTRSLGLFALTNIY